jgi:single-strand DNA-binding protein
MNSVNLYGHFGADPEMKFTTTGKAVTNFRIAVNSGWGEKKETEWVNCVAWEKLAEKVAEIGGKGKEVAVFGRMKTRSWEDREGNKQRSTEVHASNVVISDWRAEKSEAPPAPASRTTLELDQDDIPF